MIASVFRPVYHVKDRDGKVTIVALYFDNGTPFDSKLFRVGNTICVKYGFSKQFLDGSFGVRVEEPSSIQGNFVNRPLA
jgi:hypothetical protein